ncbi:MAG: GUN4 domain-containing protein [Cyanobacteria bacterium SBC]|nr:GUN4 domain-containing protein [Cyanobacteria bacterium SBC]
MSVCPICETPYSEAIDRCVVCGWDLTSESIEALSRQPTHRDWVREIWQQRQSLISSQSLLEDRLTDLERKLDWISYNLGRVDLERIDRTLSEIALWLGTGDSEISLDSEAGIDYRPLKVFLETQRWREADLKTWEIVLLVAQREFQGWLRLEDIEAFPTTDIDTINNLWYANSDGRFGLSVQGEIWRESGENYSDFCDRVGWRVAGNWKYYDDLTFDLKAPLGHLPLLAWRKRACYGMGGCTASEGLAAFTVKSEECSGGQGR